jgi:hypothetical protein
MLILRRRAADIYPNELVFSAQEDKDGKMRYTTALVTQKYTNEQHKSICFHMIDTWKPASDEVLMVVPDSEELLVAVSHWPMVLFWFLIGTAIASLIWLAAIYLIR